MGSFATSFALGLGLFWFYGKDNIALFLAIAMTMLVVTLVGFFYQNRLKQKQKQKQDQDQAERQEGIEIIPFSGVVAGLLLGCSLGILWGMLDNTLRQPWQVHVDRQVHQLQGTIISLPKHYPHYTDIVLRLAQFDGRPAKGKVKVYWSVGGRQAAVGQIWQFAVKIKPVTGVHNAAGIDREKWMFQQNIAMVATVQKHPQPKLLARSDGLWIQKMRATLSRSIGKVLVDSDMKGVIQGMTLADRRYLRPNDYEIFQRTGTGHLLAISGLHIGMIAGLAWLFSGFIWRLLSIQWCRFPRQCVQAGASLLAGLIYAALAGFSIPTTRAVTMLAVFSFYAMRYQKGDAWQAWSLAMIALCLLDPRAVLSVGFVLSFGAVACLLWLNTSKRVSGGQWRQQLESSAWLLLAMLPLSLGLFQQVSLVSFFANLIAIPWVMFLVLPAALLGVGLIQYWPLVAKWALLWSAYAMQTLAIGLTWLATPAWALWWHAIPGLTLSCLAMLGVILLLLPKHFPGRSFAWALIVPALWPWLNPVATGAAQVNVIDVGQGLAVMVQTKEHTLLFDTGPSHVAGGNAGANIIMPLLRKHGIIRIDKVIISHGDDDHVGGLEAINKLTKIDELLSGEPKKTKIPNAKRCVDGQHWVWDEVDFTIIHPSKKGDRGNNQSCVLKVATRQNSLLLPGDLEKKGELRLLERYSGNNVLAATLLVAGHHGSKTSSSEAFVNKVQPRWVIYSTGAFNRFGFPHESVVERFNKLGAKAINTAESGEIEIMMPASRPIHIKTNREENHQIWAWLYGEVY